MENRKGFICIVELGIVWGILLVIVLAIKVMGSVV